jgi:hypothetical protein
MSTPSGSSDREGTTAVVAVGLLMVLCCAGPLLVASAVGGALRNPWLITVGAVVVLAAVVHVLWCRVRRRRGAGPEDCCPSVTSPSDTADQVRPAWLERGRRPAPSMTTGERRALPAAPDRRSRKRHRPGPGVRARSLSEWRNPG